MKQNNNIREHFAALFTVFIWGTTYISTKILLVDFQAIEILFFRFVIGFLTLMVIYPKRLKGTSIKQELMFVLAGLSGVTLYFLLENIALTYSMASNVGVITAVAPFFTGIMSYIFLKEERPKGNFFIGFITSMMGIFMISFNGTTEFHLNPLGDFLALLAVIMWAVYSVFTKKISAYGYSTIQTTRRTFLYGLIFMIPALFFFDFQIGLERFTNTTYLFNILFLGFGASALCFVTWNLAVKALGAVKTSVYIYAVPVITVVTSVIVLHEKITKVAAIGTLLTLAGLFFSQSKIEFKKKSQSLAMENDQ